MSPPLRSMFVALLLCTLGGCLEHLQGERDGGVDGATDDGGVDAAMDDGGAPVWVTLGGDVWVSPPHPTPGEPVSLRYHGVLVDEPVLIVRYGYDGWNEVADAAAEDDGTGNLDFFFEAPLEPRPGGGFEGQLTPPPDARALHLVFRTPALVWDNNAQLDYGFGLRVPYLGPFLTWDAGRSPSHTLNVHFDSGYECVGRVEYGPDTSLGLEALDGTAARMHHLALAGLQPATTYHYRVGCQGGEMSERFTVQTAPSTGAEVTMAVLADSQENGETTRWKEVAAALEAAHPGVDLLLVSGDLPWNDRPGLWWLFFDGGRSLLATRPVLFAPGNHDTPTTGSYPDTASLEHLLGLATAGELVREHWWGDVAFLLLDSERPEEFAQGSGAQYLRAAAILDAWRAAPPTWAFASWHIGPYGAGARHSASQGTFRDITELFDGLVDWVLAGHEHLCQRMVPLQYNAVVAPSGQYGRGPDDGVGYLVVPPAGAWPETGLIAWDGEDARRRDRLAYPIPSPQNDTVPSDNGYVIVALTATTITLTTYALDDPPRVVDEVTYAR